MTGLRKKFLAPELLEQAALQIDSLAGEQDVPLVLVGGFAMQFYGSDRLTGDVDFAADRSLSGLPEGKALSFGGVQTQAPNGVPVDLIVRDDEYQDLYEAAIDNPVTDDDTGLLIAAPEYLAAMKMVAGRQRDMGDLEVLILSGELDLTKTRQVVRKFLGQYAVREFDRIVDEAVWRARR
jgi:hypothetical protein